MSKANTDEDVFAKCPYYKCQSQSVIYCEGAWENSCIHLAFGGKAQRREYQRQFCRDDWNRCIIAGAQNRKWGYEE